MLAKVTSQARDGHMSHIPLKFHVNYNHTRLEFVVKIDIPFRYMGVHGLYS